MTESAGVAALREYSAKRSHAKAAQVVAAIEYHTEAGARISVSSVAKSAGVSREFIYEHKELLAAIRRARAAQPAPTVGAGPASSREESLLSERTMLMAKIQAQAAQLRQAQDAIADFEKQREHWLGTQLDQLMQPAKAAELIGENERLSRRVVELTRHNDQLQRSLLEVSEELRIARLAHAETASQLRSESHAELPRIHPGRS